MVGKCFVSMVCKRLTEEDAYQTPNVEFALKDLLNIRYKVQRRSQDQLYELLSTLTPQAKTTGNRVRCDIYEMPLSFSSYEKLCDRFIAFLESINRIRRINVPQRTRQRHPTPSNDTSMTSLISYSERLGVKASSHFPSIKIKRA
ncbi:hypothetical protein ACTXT7_007288 [Hymenolepis weldensis]